MIAIDGQREQRTVNDLYCIGSRTSDCLIFDVFGHNRIFRLARSTSLYRYDNQSNATSGVAYVAMSVYRPIRSIYFVDAIAYITMTMPFENAEWRNAFPPIKRLHGIMRVPKTSIVLCL